MISPGLYNALLTGLGGLAVFLSVFQKKCQRTQIRVQQLVYAQHGRETNGVKVPCRRTYFIELYGDDNY
jgi:hypothetical protein